MTSAPRVFSGEESPRLALRLVTPVGPSRLTLARLRAGLTVTELARALHVARPTVSIWERGDRGVARSYWPALAAALGLREDELPKLFEGSPPARLDAVRLPSLAPVRRARGMTQRALAERLDVAPTTLAMWETAGVRVHVARTQQLCVVLGVDLTSLTVEPPAQTPDPRPLRGHRRAAGMSRAEAATALGVSMGTLARYEAGERPTPIPVVRRMARAYGRSVEDLLPYSGSRLVPLPPNRRWRPEEVPQAIRALRTAAGLTRVGLGRAVGRSGNTVARWEAGHTLPMPGTLRRLEVIFGIAPGRFPR
jgi:transcriptional regulator with XRE-family HTH domain